ncbi:MAG: hypothetical protein ACRET1_04820, partial [Burkholderiales bacterium]
RLNRQAAKNAKKKADQKTTATAKARRRKEKPQRFSDLVFLCGYCLLSAFPLRLCASAVTPLLLPFLGALGALAVTVLSPRRAAAKIFPIRYCIP